MTTITESILVAKYRHSELFKAFVIGSDCYVGDSVLLQQAYGSCNEWLTFNNSQPLWFGVVIATTH